MDLLTSHAGVFADGLLTSLEISAWTFLLAAAGGLVLAVCRIAPVATLRWAARWYVNTFRNVPLLVLLTLFVFGLPEIGVLYPLFWTVVTAMALYWAAFFCETVRSGIRSVPRGQAEAARALGMTARQVLTHIVLPQALRRTLQPTASLLIAVILNSSLAAAVGVTQELTGQTVLLDQRYAQPLTTFGAAAACYVILTLAVGRLAARLERRLVITG
ncbi:amino acid ABC transporter permease [Streptomyces sp. NPDC006654]|uniref:amino acid ABC transporter permease n=1 Tax=Streptomyces sp. NPDC006654 TaxID=3156897 RepID=UPI0033C20394